MTDYREEDGPTLLNLAVWLVVIAAVIVLWYVTC